jgi:hypothetical protein
MMNPSRRRHQYLGTGHLDRDHHDHHHDRSKGSHMQQPRPRFLSTLVLVAALAGGGCGAEIEDPGGSGGSAPAGSGGRGGSAGSDGSAGSGGSAGSSGSPASGGRGGSAGTAGTGGSAGSGGSAGAPRSDARPADSSRAADRPRDGGGTGTDAGTSSTPPPGARFSFFYTSLEAMRRLSGSQNGFGGNLTFGTGNGLDGADKICQTIAAGEGFGSKTWKAFLSVVQGPDGMPVHAIDRIGQGPWYDRNGRLIAMNRAGLLAGNRPQGDPQAVNDLVDEKGRGRPSAQPNDTHDVITGTNRQGRLATTNRANTCQDWTAASGTGSIQLGHSWPAGSGASWMTVHTARNCAAGVNLTQNGPGNGQSIGAGGGWGGIYCFATTP